MVLRYRDEDGVKSLRLLLQEPARVVSLPGRGQLLWCLANGGGTAFFRTRYTGTLMGQLYASFSDLTPRERLAFMLDQWALVRAGQLDTGAFLDLVITIGHDQDYTVLYETLEKLVFLDEQCLTDEERRQWYPEVAIIFGDAATAVGWSLRKGAEESEDERMRRVVLFQAMAVLARHGPAEEAALRLFTVERLSEETSAEFLEIAATVAVRRGGREVFDELSRLFREESEPVAKRLYLQTLARAERPEVVARAIAFAFSTELPRQDFPSFIAELLKNPATREHFWCVLRERWEEACRTCGSLHQLRTIVEALAPLGSRYLEEVETHLLEHTPEGLIQTVAHTLARMRLHAQVQIRLRHETTAWLCRRQGGTEPFGASTRVSQSGQQGREPG